MNGRIINKRIHVRIEHVRPSRCREEFLQRCKENDEKKHAAKVAGGERSRGSWTRGSCQLVEKRRERSLRRISAGLREVAEAVDTP